MSESLFWPWIAVAHQLAGPLGGTFVEPKGLLVAAMVRAFGDEPDWTELPAASKALAELHVPADWFERVDEFKPYRIGAVTRESKWLLERALDAVGSDGTPRTLLVALAQALRDTRKGRKIAVPLELGPTTLDDLIAAAES